MQEDAIVLKYAYKHYGRKQSPILDGLNMTVPRGCIYGLLGASGCGKTTLLSCIVGVRKLNDGEIWVLGGKPGQKDSGIPGPRVGYMPQEISLVGEFSVIGALDYFGRINGLEDSEIDERHNFFSKLLQLPPKDQLVKNLSGGQQRRVSLAAALIHKPELLILDEPTVGLDPILRENIWKFLTKLTKEEGTTVVITTHYIEETKLADKIGLLRNGQLLAETTPLELLSRFDCQSLEEAFLILSQKQNERTDRVTPDVHYDGIAMSDLEQVPTSTLSTTRSDRHNGVQCTVNSERREMDNEHVKKKKSLQFSTLRSIFRALMIKNFFQIVRHPGTVLFAFIFPLLHATTYFLAYSGDIKGIVVAVVNDEAGHCDYGRNLGQVVYKPDDNLCNYIDISCRFLHGFNESIMVKQYFDTLEEATLAVQSGKAAGSIYFSQNFSQAFQDRRDAFFGSISDDDVAASEIHTKIDMNDFYIGYFLQKSLLERFIDIHKEIVSSCSISEKFANVPIYFEEPVFGEKDQKHSRYLAPGFIMTLIFLLATNVSASIIIADRAEGVWDRSLVQGVTTSAILFSHIFTQILVVFIQVTFVLLVSFGFFQLSCQGNFGLVIALGLITGICGMCYGFLISVLCTPSHSLANFLASGSFLPVFLLSGTTWPLEAMLPFVRYVSWTFPATTPTIAMRALLEKGYSILEFEVYSGFLVPIFWTSIFLILSVLFLRKSS